MVPERKTQDGVRERKLAGKMGCIIFMTTKIKKRAIAPRPTCRATIPVTWPRWSVEMVARVGRRRND